MKSFLCVTVRFLQPYSHGRGEDRGPEWPPSPLRLMQALIAGSAGRWNERDLLQHVTEATRWLETLPTPRIIAPPVAESKPYRLYVPDNVADKVAAAWSRGREATIADYRTEKDVVSTIIEGEAVHYLYELPTTSTDWRDFISVLTSAARSITHLGWGIDMATGDVTVLTEEQAAELEGVHWRPSPVGGTPLRVPKSGTLDDLIRKHSDFLNRLTDDGFRPVPPLRVFDVVRYRPQHEPLKRPFGLFELRKPDGSRFRYPQSKLIHIAGMVRHLAIQLMTVSPPSEIDDIERWVRTYVAGHREQNTEEHRQFSYFPLPSIGRSHTDPGVRRVMVTAPVGDERFLMHLVRYLSGQALIPTAETKLTDPPVLVRLGQDNVTCRYTTASQTWASVTPVILPGHDDHKPEKRRKLIEKALAQSGIDQPCEFESSPFSHFPKSLSAHKYDLNKRPTGYIRPNHLLSQTAVHLKLRFGHREVPGDPESRWISAEFPMPGPIVIGAGRHCGFGLMANCDSF